MNALLLPLASEPDLSVTVYCEGCADPVERRDTIQCRCGMEYHQRCWWDLDAEMCKRCTLLRLDRLERVMVALLRGDEVEAVREELLKARAA